MARAYWCAYFSMIESLSPLTDEEVGRLFRALTEYAKSGEIPSLSGNERFLFPSCKDQIDRDSSKYEDFCKKQKSNIEKRWSKEESNGYHGIPPYTKNTTVYDGTTGIPNDTKHTNDKEKEKEKENDKDKDTNPSYSPSFERFWKAYPKKVGKDAAKRAFLKIRVSVDTLVDAVERQKHSEQWTKFNGQYIPNPATWLNQGRWQDELETAKQSNPYSNLQSLYEEFKDE